MEEAHIVAAAHWISLGATSATNPIHAFLVSELIEPLGIRCSYMVCDPVTHEKVLMLPTMITPTWRADLVRPDLAALCPSDATAAFYTTSIDVGGVVSFVPAALGETPPKLLPEMDRFNGGKELNAVVQRARIAVAQFLIHVFEVTCLPSARPADSALFIDDPVAMARKIWTAA